MESYEFYLQQIFDNANKACTNGVRTLDELNCMFDAYGECENAIKKIAEHYPDKINDFAQYLDSENRHIRKTVGRGILFYMKPEKELEDKAIDVLVAYARSATEGEALMWRGYLLEWGEAHGRDTGVNDDISFRKRT